MQFTLKKPDLIQVTGIVKNGLAENKLNPILRHFKVEADNQGKVYFTAANGEIKIQVQVQAEQTGSAGSTAIPGKLLDEFIRMLPGDDGLVVFDLDQKTNTVNIKSGRFESNIKCLGLDNWPDLKTFAVPGASKPIKLEVEAADLKKAIKNTTWAIADDKTDRPTLMSVYFDPKIEPGSNDYVVRVVSTNSYVFALNEIKMSDLDPIQPLKPFLIPGRILNVIANCLDDHDGKILLSLVPALNLVYIEAGELSIEAKLDQGKFVSYDKFIESLCNVNDNSTSFEVEVDQFKQTIQSVSKMSQSKDGLVEVTLTKGPLFDETSLVIKGGSTLIGSEARAELDCQVDGSGEFAELIRADQAQQILSRFQSTRDRISLYSNGPKKPMIFTAFKGVKPTPDALGDLYIVSPMINH